MRTRTAELEEALHENKKITGALRESEAKFHGLVSQSLVGIVIVENNKFSYSNAKFNEIFGYSAEEIHQLGPLGCSNRKVLIGLIMDVSERIRAERELQALQERLFDQSIHDALTDLYNRRYLRKL
ncbi:PAS domain S-box protein [Legionella hackeliae]|uniref:PAS domain-containing protein n=1 Tax=Legionella hackeliae TaxID=449 RepID=A0A0A8UXB3_LEGHA|nr:PAS domain S-box protein [Legionella hackeliae]KTD09942.1 hypothetical protein Lhac_2310 [Legionella hackeliae]CEK11757.1 protein of unknown function [Legionella hackeliae]STX48528.1 PAS domain S-box protein [Legionella hackeliae]